MSNFVKGYVEVKATYEGFKRSLFSKSAKSFTETVKVPVCGKPNYSATIESYLQKECRIYDAINSCTYDEWQSMKVFRSYEKANDYAKEVAELDLLPDESVVIVPLLLDTCCPLPIMKGKALK